MIAIDVPQKKEKGFLYIVATPIGNLEDITLRALNVLKKADLVAAEDTRRTRKLLSFYDIHKPMVSFREQNRVYQGEKLLEELERGKNVALCSDAGTPLISDPGSDFVRKCIREGVRLEIIPGANAAVSALVISGLPTNTFLFLGFPPRKKKKQRLLLQQVSDLPHTLIFYQSPRRLIRFLKDLEKYLGDRNACVVRELTKIHEEVLRGSLSEIIKKIEGKDVLGEITVLVEGAGETGEEEYFITSEVVDEAKEMISRGIPKNKTLKYLARKYNTSKSVLYSLLLEDREKSS